MREAINDILSDVEVTCDEFPHFKGKNHTAFKLSKDNFKGIDIVDSDKKICFIDGGNSEIIGAHNFSLQLLRVYYSIYQRNKKIDSKTFGVYLLVSAKNVSGKLSFVSKLFNTKSDLNLPVFSFDIYDDTLKSDASGVKIEGVCDAIRRFYELSVAKHVCDNKLCDAIVIDGSLEVTVTKEKEVMEKLYESAIKNSVSVFAISKTSSMVTESGKSTLGVLNSIGPRSESWIYHPIIDIKNDDWKVFLYVIKLHPKSGYVFKFERFDKSLMDVDEIASILLINSRDAVFLGYPYGLIDADKHARVQNREVEVQKMKLFSIIGKDFEKVRYSLNSKNAHSILDNIS